MMIKQITKIIFFLILIRAVTSKESIDISCSNTDFEAIYDRYAMKEMMNYENVKNCVVNVIFFDSLKENLQILEDEAKIDAFFLITHKSNDTSAIIKLLLEKFQPKFLKLRQSNFHDLDKNALNVNNSLLVLTFQLVEIGPIRRNSFRKLGCLIGLSFEKLSIEQIDEGSFAGLKSLLYLVIIQAQLKTLPDTLFDDCKLLKFLDLGENLLESINLRWFKHLSDLEYLSLRANQITSVPEYAWVDNKKLNTLGLEHNYIRTISRTNMVTFQNFLALYLNNNDCVNVDFSDREADRILNRSRAILIETILFPHCDDRSADLTSKSRDEVFYIKVFLLVAIISSLLMLTVFLRLKLTVYGRNKVVDISNGPREVFDFKSLWKEYVDSTTIHGIRYMGEKNSHWTER